MSAPTLRRSRPEDVDQRPRRLTEARLLAVAGAVPDTSIGQMEMGHRLARLWGLDGEAAARWWRIVEGSAIDQRRAVRAPEGVVALGTAERLAIFAQEAPALAEAAARRALDRAEIHASQVSDVIVVTCTGFRAPGVDVELVDRLGLDRGVRRSQIGFMGCFGAITGLRAAAGACSADRRGVALLICVELCSLHARADASLQNQVCCALFGDAAVAAVIAGPELVARRASREGARPGWPATSGRRIGLGFSRLLPAGRDAMTWTVTDAGFSMTLGREVPTVLREAVRGLCGSSQLPRRLQVAVHPGGVAILDAVDEALDLRGGHGIEQARAVLREFGNVSSGTVLLVAERVMAESTEPLTLLAFGPGLTLEASRLGEAEAQGWGGG